MKVNMPSWCLFVHKKMLSIPRQQTGFSLLEMMLSMTIAITVIAMATGSVDVSSSSLNFLRGRLVAQQDARAVLDMMGRDLRMAGYFGCNSQPYQRQPYPHALSDQSNVFSVQYAGNGIIISAISLLPGKLQLTLPAGANWQSWQPLLLSTCHSVRVLPQPDSVYVPVSGNRQVLNFSLDTTGLESVVAEAQADGAQLLPLVAKRYFLTGSGVSQQLWREERLADGRVQGPDLLLGQLAMVKLTSWVVSETGQGQLPAYVTCTAQSDTGPVVMNLAIGVQHQGGNVQAYDKPVVLRQCAGGHNVGG